MHIYVLCSLICLGRVSAQNDVFHVAVLQVEPLADADGGGFASDVVSELNAVLVDHGIELQLTTVNSYEELQNHARQPHSVSLCQSFGVLEMTDSSWQDLQASFPLILDGVKALVRRGAFVENYLDVNEDEDVSLVVMRQSPLLDVLLQLNQFAGHYILVDSFQEGLDFTRNSLNAAFIMDGGLADHYANAPPLDLRRVCLRNFRGVGMMSYVFYGAEMPTFLDDGVLDLMAKGILDRLFRRHFRNVFQCPLSK